MCYGNDILKGHTFENRLKKIIQTVSTSTVYAQQHSKVSCFKNTLSELETIHFTFYYFTLAIDASVKESPTCQSTSGTSKEGDLPLW